MPPRASLAAGYAPSSIVNPPGAGNIERIGMLSLRRRHIVAVIPESLIDGIHARFALNKKAIRKVAGILDVSRLLGLHQRQHESVIVRQDGQAGVPAFAPQSEIRFDDGSNLPIRRFGRVACPRSSVASYHSLWEPRRSCEYSINGSLRELRLITLRWSGGKPPFRTCKLPLDCSSG